MEPLSGADGPLVYTLDSLPSSFGSMSAETYSEFIQNLNSVISEFPMGMYTGFRADVVVRPEWRPAIECLHRTRADNPNGLQESKDWEVVAREFPSLPGVEEWAGVWRADFIPFGALAYMPDDWSDAPDRESYSHFDVDTGRWRFCCSLKNYDGEIATFTRVLLSRIVERVAYCESQYEGDDAPSAAFTPTQLFRIGVARVAALEGVSFETALRLPNFVLKDRILDEGKEGDEVLAEAVLVRPAQKLYDLCQRLADRLGSDPLTWADSIGPGESNVIVTVGNSLFPTRFFLRGVAPWTGGLGDERATDEERSAIVDEIRRLGPEASDAWRMTAAGVA